MFYAYLIFIFNNHFRIFHFSRIMSCITSNAINLNFNKTFNKIKIPRVVNSKRSIDKVKQYFWNWKISWKNSRNRSLNFWVSQNQLNLKIKLSIKENKRYIVLRWILCQILTSGLKMRNWNASGSKIWYQFGKMKSLLRLAVRSKSSWTQKRWSFHFRETRKKPCFDRPRLRSE